MEDLKNNNAQEKEIRIRNTKQIELLKEQVEDLRKITAVETCSQLSKQGVTRGKDIYLDSDGVNYGKKQLLTLIIVLYPCSFWIGFRQLNFETFLTFWGGNLTLIQLFLHHTQLIESYKKLS